LEAAHPAEQPPLLPLEESPTAEEVVADEEAVVTKDVTHATKMQTGRQAPFLKEIHQT
jgi:hypothetical protein